jgi:hypothetical protein
MANVIEDWLISFANDDWNSMGTLCLYATAQKGFQRSLSSHDENEAKRQLEKRFSEMERNGLRAALGQYLEQRYLTLCFYNTSLCVLNNKH